MDKTKELAELLEKTGHSHHQAFIKTDGFDPEWALWYADHLQAPLSEILQTSLTKSKIIYELLRMEESLEIQSTWAEAYAKELIRKYN